MWLKVAERFEALCITQGAGCCGVSQTPLFHARFMESAVSLFKLLIYGGRGKD